MKIGDIVKGKEGSSYGITNEKMTRGVITKVNTKAKGENK